MAVPTLLAGEIPDASKWSDILEFLGFGVVKAVSENLSSNAALQDDDELRLSMVANRLYAVTASFIQNSNSTADFKFSFVETSSGGVDGYFDVVAIPSGGTALTIQSGTFGTVFTGEGASANRAMLVTGWISVGANSGDVLVQWAQNTSNASTTSMIADSYLTLRRLS